MSKRNEPERASARFHRMLADVHAELANLHTHASDREAEYPMYDEWDDALNSASSELRVAEYAIACAARYLFMREGS